ncbi:DNA alkylation repair protein [Chitinophaga lutea]
MTFHEVMDALRGFGSETTRRTLLEHGAVNTFGVKVSDLKTILKQIKKDQALALQLFGSGQYDAQYLAGLAADGKQMTEAQLHDWAANAVGPGISEYSVPWVTAEHPQAQALALQWIDDDREKVASAGWNTLGGLVSLDTFHPDIPLLEKLLQRVQRDIHTASNRVRYTMNGFVIALGTYVDALTDQALAAATKIGKVDVFMGNTACKVPGATEYIQAARSRPGGPRKKKTLKC